MNGSIFPFYSQSQPVILTRILKMLFQFLLIENPLMHPKFVHVDHPHQGFSDFGWLSFQSKPHEAHGWR